MWGKILISHFGKMWDLYEIILGMKNLKKCNINPATVKEKRVAITLVDVLQNWFNWLHFLFLVGGLRVVLID